MAGQRKRFTKILPPVSMTEAMKQGLEGASFDLNLTISEIVRQAVDEWLKKHSTQEPEQFMEAA